MVRRRPIKLFVEGGGGKGNKALVSDAQRSFGELIRKATGESVSVVACGGRDAAFKKFAHHLAIGDCRPLLLVDAEGPVVDVHRPWTHLATPGGGGWGRPEAADDSHAHLMVQVMETWLLADIEAFRGVVDLDARKIPRWPSLEEVAKDTILATLERATGLPLGGGRGSLKSKGFWVLERVQPGELRRRCPAAERLFLEVGSGAHSVR